MSCTIACHHFSLLVGAVSHSVKITKGDITDHNHRLSHPSGCQAIHSHEVVQKIGEKLGVARLERGEAGAPGLKLK